MRCSPADVAVAYLLTRSLRKNFARKKAVSPVFAALAYILSQRGIGRYAEWPVLGIDL